MLRRFVVGNPRCVPRHSICSSGQRWQQSSRKIANCDNYFAYLTVQAMAMFNPGVTMSKCRFRLVAVLCLTFSLSLLGQDTQYPPEGEQIPGPSHQTGANSDGLPLCC